MEREPRPRLAERLNLVVAELGFSSPSVVFTDFSVRDTMPSVLEVSYSHVICNTHIPKHLKYACTLKFIYDHLSSVIPQIIVDFIYEYPFQVEPLFTSQPYWNTSLLKSSNWLETLLVIIRRPESTLVTCNSLSVTTKN